MGIHYSDPAMDEMFVAEQTNTVDAERKAIFEKIQMKWTVDVPTCPIFQGTLYLFSQNNIDGIMISPTLQFIYGPIQRK